MPQSPIPDGTSIPRIDAAICTKSKEKEGLWSTEASNHEALRNTYPMWVVFNDEVLARKPPKTDEEGDLMWYDYANAGQTVTLRVFND